MRERYRQMLGVICASVTICALRILRFSNHAMCNILHCYEYFHKFYMTRALLFDILQQTVDLLNTLIAR